MLMSATHWNTAVATAASTHTHCCAVQATNASKHPVQQPTPVSSSMSLWLMLMSAMYWNTAVATGIHLAWSLPMPNPKHPVQQRAETKKWPRPLQHNLLSRPRQPNTKHYVATSRTCQFVHEPLINADVSYVLEHRGGHWDPLGVVLADALARNGPQLDLLVAAQLHNHHCRQ
jgi:hypothetical protein